MNEQTSKRDLTEQAMRRQWWPVARLDELTKPVAATLLGEKLVVYRTESGRIAVQSSRCPHRGGNLAIGKIRGESIACPYHGWEYSGETGHCTRVPSLADQSKIPPQAAIKTYPVVARYGHVWTVLEESSLQMYDLPEWRGLDLDWLAVVPVDCEHGVAVAMENFRDVSHFPFVHEPSMGPSDPVIEPLQVRRDGLDVWMDRPVQVSTGPWATDGNCSMLYHCVAPGLASITYDYETLGKRIVAGFPSPISYTKVRYYLAVANEKTFKGKSLAEWARLEEMVYLEDVPVATTLEPREIDWDGNYVEFSVPADLYTLNYRRAFRDFVARAHGGA